MVETRADRFIDYHDGYLAAMGGAHRKPVPQLGTPAISHHIGYRAPHGVERGKWVAAVEGFCWRLWADLETKCRPEDRWSPNLEKGGGRLLLFDGTYERDEKSPGAWKPASSERQIREDHHRVVVFSWIWETLPISLSIELHTEYFTLTGYIDLSATSDTTPGAGRDLCRHVRQLSRRLSVYEAFLKSWPREDADKYRELRIKFRKLMQRSHDHIYFDGWRELYRNLFEPAFARVRPRIDEKTAFADFRGFVFTSTKFNRQSAATRGDDRYFMNEPGWNPRPRRLSDDIGTGSFRRERLTQRTIETIWPFLTSDPALREDGEDKEDKEDASSVPFHGRKTEYTISRFLGDRYLYATALGPQVPNEQRPLCYLVIAASGHRWQTGRLLDRINHLGSVRLAALWDLRAIDRASEALRAAEELFQNISSKLAGLPTQEKHRDTLAEVREEFGEATNLLASAASLPKKEAASTGAHQTSSPNKPPGEGRDEDASHSSAVREGLDYRIERSRYYSKQFRDGIAVLRIKRIEGFQPYDQFVLQRLASSYEFIDMVGLRHVRLRELATSVNQRIQAERQHMVQVSIKEIQGAGELFFFLFLFPYYLGSVLKASKLYLYVPWLTSDDRLFVATLVSGVFLAVVFRHDPILRLAKVLAKGLLIGAFIVVAILVSMVLTHCSMNWLSP